MDEKKTADRCAYEAEVVGLFMRDVDVVSMVDRLGSVKDYLELLDLFETDGPRRLELLDSLAAGRDPERYTIEVHGLKSASANVGAGKLSALARRHEEAGKAADLAFILENLPVLKENYQGVLAEIRRVLTARAYGRFAPRDAAVLPPIGAEELRTRAAAALACLEDFESKQAAAEVDALLGFALPEAARETLERVRSLLKVYEDDQAEALLQSFLDNG